MQMPQSSQGPDEILRIGQEHLDRMAPVPELASLVARFQPVQTRFAAAITGWRTALSAVRTAHTHRMEAFTALDGTLRLTLTAVRNRAHCSRKPGMIDLYFPDGLRPFLRTNASLIKNSGVLLAKLEDQTDPALRGLVDPLASAINQGSDAVTAFEVTRAGARAARGTLLAERLQWEIEYQRDYYDLDLLYKGIDGRAELFFWRPAKVSSSAKPSDPAGGEVPVTTAASEGGSAGVDRRDAWARGAP